MFLKDYEILYEKKKNGFSSKLSSTPPCQHGAIIYPRLVCRAVRTGNLAQKEDSSSTKIFTEAHTRQKLQASSDKRRRRLSREAINWIGPFTRSGLPFSLTTQFTPEITFPLPQEHQSPKDLQQGQSQPSLWQVDSGPELLVPLHPGTWFGKNKLAWPTLPEDTRVPIIHLSVHGILHRTGYIVHQHMYILQCVPVYSAKCLAHSIYCKHLQGNQGRLCGMV